MCAQTIRDLDMEVMGLKGDIAQRNESIAEKERSMHTLDKRLEDLEKQRSALQDKCQDLVKHIEPHAAEVDALNADIMVINQLLLLDLV